MSLSFSLPLLLSSSPSSSSSAVSYVSMCIIATGGACSCLFSVAGVVAGVVAGWIKSEAEAEPGSVED